jgi:hypothetical protein
MIPVTDIVTPRFQLAVLAAILFQGLQFVTMLTIISAAEQEMPRRHSLIHRSAIESTALPATTHGTMLQPPSAEPTRITSPIGPPKTSVSPPTMPLAHRQTLTKRPAIASETASAASSQTLRAALTSGVAAGQVTQTRADTAKSKTSTPTAPITKSSGAPLPVVTSAGSGAVAPTTSSPFAGAAGVRHEASAGSGSVPSFSGSRSTLNLLQNSALSSLLQSPTTGTANGESDLAGYKVYVGTASGTYSFPGSAFLTGEVTNYTVSNLPKGQTYFFAISAYDIAGNESALSAEVSKSLY